MKPSQNNCLLYQLPLGCNLGQIHFYACDKYIFKTRTNTFSKCNENLPKKQLPALSVASKM